MSHSTQIDYKRVKIGWTSEKDKWRKESPCEQALQSEDEGESDDLHILKPEEKILNSILLDTKRMKMVYFWLRSPPMSTSWQD